MSAADKNRLRGSFRPNLPIRFLMIGESPPKGENFFYLGKGAVYEHTQSVFKDVFKNEQVPAGKAFLEWFQSRGCYVEDLCLESTNGMKWGSTERKSAWRLGESRLSNVVAELKPHAVFVFVRGITQHVKKALTSSSSQAFQGSLVPFYDGPMPESRGDPVGREFETALRYCLAELQSEKVL